MFSVLQVASERLYQDELMALILPHLPGSIFGQSAVPQDRIIIGSVPREAADQLVSVS
jgi:hypothetical protein